MPRTVGRGDHFEYRHAYTRPPDTPSAIADTEPHARTPHGQLLGSAEFQRRAAAALPKSCEATTVDAPLLLRLLQQHITNVRPYRHCV